MRDKKLDTYIPLFVSNVFGEDCSGYFYINKDVSLSFDELTKIRDEWINDDKFDKGFCEYLDIKFGTKNNEKRNFKLH